MGGGHIAGATHLPLEELPERVGELDRERPVVLYCRGGTRSTMATEALTDAGFDAAKLSEGIVGWDEAGLSSIPRAATWPSRARPHPSSRHEKGPSQG